MDDSSTVPVICRRATRAARSRSAPPLARIRANGVHAGCSRAGRKNGSMTSEARRPDCASPGTTGAPPVPEAVEDLLLFRADGGREGLDGAVDRDDRRAQRAELPDHVAD